MIVAASQITKDGQLIAEHHHFKDATYIQVNYKGNWLLILDVDEALNLKHLLDTALHGKKYSWQVEGEKE